MESDINYVTDVEVDIRYVGVGYSSFAVAASVRVGHVVSHERVRHEFGCDWCIVDMMNYVRHNVYLESLQVYVFAVERQNLKTVTDGKSQTGVHGA